MAKKSGLGRGLDALLAENELDSGTAVSMLRISDIEPNENQPRRTLDKVALEELADSITQHGIIQPIVVRPLENGYYQIIAGERRYKASKMAGLSEIPVIVKDIDERTAAEIALIENLQREDLNPVDEANGYRRLMDMFSFTQEQISERIGKSRSAVTNSLRLLKLPPEVLAKLENGELTSGHARALLGLHDMDTANIVAERIIKQDMTVRDTEKLVRELNGNSDTKPAREMPDNAIDAYYYQLERKISGVAGRQIKITRKRGDGNQGKLEIVYTSPNDLEGILRIICGDKELDDVFAEIRE